MLWIMVFMLLFLFFFFFLLWQIPHLIRFRNSFAFFITVTLAIDSPELMHLGPPATSSSQVAETAKFQHGEIKFCCISCSPGPGQSFNFPVWSFSLSLPWQPFSVLCPSSLSFCFYVRLIPEVLIPKSILEMFCWISTFCPIFPFKHRLLSSCS